MPELEQSGFSEFDRWLGLARRTRELLDAADRRGRAARRRRRLPRRPDPATRRERPGRLRRLAPARCGRRRRAPLPARPGRGDAGRGRPPTSRAAGRRRRDRGRARLRRPGGPRAVDPPRRRAVESRGACATPALVLAMLPRIPDDDVRYPAGRRTYADIAGPARPRRAVRTDRRAGAIALADRRAGAGGRGSAPGRFRRNGGRVGSGRLIVQGSAPDGQVWGTPRSYPPDVAATMAGAGRPSRPPLDRPGPDPA